MVYEVTIDGKNYRLDLERVEAGWRCRLDGREIQVDAVLARRDVLSVLIGGKAYEIKRERTATDMHLWVGKRSLRRGIARSKITAWTQRCSAR